MSRFHGPQPGEKADRGPNRTNGPKGVMARLRQLKADEAEARNEVTDPERRAAWRREKQRESSV